MLSNVPKLLLHELISLRLFYRLKFFQKLPNKNFKKTQRTDSKKNRTNKEGRFYESKGMNPYENFHIDLFLGAAK